MKVSSNWPCPLVLSMALAMLGACTTVPLPIDSLLPAITRREPMPFSAAATNKIRCGDALEAQIWSLWDTHGRKLLRQEIHARLLQAGDTYALYDIQVYFHNLEAMAERCERTSRLVQIADDLMPLFDLQQPLPGRAEERGWLCRGGAVCNARNRLIDTEVMLVSVQGLGFFSAVAAALARAPEQQARSHSFIRKTVQASLAHLLRWGGPEMREEWYRLAAASPQDVKDESSTLFFTDKHLWQIAIYSNLASIAIAKPTLMAELDQTQEAQKELSLNVRALLAFFQSRTSLRKIASPRLGDVTVADLDRGYSRLYRDNRYAGYVGATPPVLCEPGPNGPKAHSQLDAENIPPVSDLGWDFSHARRLVQVLEALEINRAAVQAWYDLASADLPAHDLAQSFAAQLVASVWNGDTSRPLFNNYWGSANGWYRVAYDDGTGGCRAGIGPYGLSISFATGGYITWAKYYPVLGQLGRAVYAASQSVDWADDAYMKEHWRNLSSLASVNNRILTQLMFWPSLVQ